MKTLGKLKLKGAHELSNSDMKHIEGGVSLGQYCEELYYNIRNNSSNWSSGAFSGAAYGMQQCVNGGYY